MKKLFILIAFLLSISIALAQPIGPGGIYGGGGAGTEASPVTKGWFTDLNITNAPTINGAAWTTILQPLDAELTAIAGLTSAAGAIPYFTGSGTAAVLSIGGANYILGVNSAGTLPEWKSSLPISALDLTSATSSVPWVVATTTPATFNANGMAWYDSDGYALIIRDQTNTRNLTITPDSLSKLGAIPSTQTIASDATITADACGGVKRITASGAVTTNTTNTFTAPAASNAGCCMDVINIGGEVITLDNNTLFVSAGGTNVALGAGDTVRVCSTGADGKWYQIGATGNN